MKQYFASKSGKLTIAFLVVLLAFPLIQIGVNSDVNLLAYVGLAMIVGGMGFVPVYSFIDSHKK